MKKLLFVQRILASLIDLIIIYIPFLLLANFLFKSATLLPLVNLLAALLFVIYNMIAISSFEGQSLGKYFAKLQVEIFSSTTSKKSVKLMEVGQREVAKILYFLPLAGPIVAVISFICYLTKGKFLHDIIGHSTVVIRTKGVRESHDS
ncbi:RDD family protein [Lactococcus nasutitermitis]|uniref:RDD family protein n=1 Tax=Lactococcus nasutitermitis TaxID=1652957 RepID=A0ABV9JFV1_9LACT|nr:RDD family protein [Lactococcus nasutitermitis]